ncbi:uncharacterized protein ACWYII_017696 isoform 3-T3 [Salvelinus alpinus]|uniref:uncharacterized protein isoform X3 n=1 Tax=Salvelinus alpinus TaxID=8036 RepID=UPI0039FBDCD6
MSTVTASVVDVSRTIYSTKNGNRGRNYTAVSPSEDFGFRVAVVASIISCAIILLMSIAFITCCLLDCVTEEEKKKEERETRLWHQLEQVELEENRASRYGHNGRNNNNNTQEKALPPWVNNDPSMCTNKRPSWLGLCVCVCACVHACSCVSALQSSMSLCLSSLQVSSVPLCSDWSSPGLHHWPSPQLSSSSLQRLQPAHPPTQLRPLPQPRSATQSRSTSKPYPNPVSRSTSDHGPGSEPSGTPRLRPGQAVWRTGGQCISTSGEALQDVSTPPLCQGAPRTGHIRVRSQPGSD